MKTEDAVLADAHVLSAPSEAAKDNSDKNEYEDKKFEERVLEGYVTDGGLMAPGIVDEISSSDRNIRLEAVRKIHRMAQRRERIAVKAAIDSGLVRTLV
ncbi:hypothetical protein FS837_006568 [Tulasnella sp. UAMH 9824]|nr:hypothetical protein FS837_006568 [Tulasnella sp. UAMH 9824]